MRHANRRQRRERANGAGGCFLVTGACRTGPRASGATDFPAAGTEGKGYRDEASVYSGSNRSYGKVGAALCELVASIYNSGAAAAGKAHILSAASAGRGSRW